MYKFEEVWWVIIIALAVLMSISDFCMWYKNRTKKRTEYGNIISNIVWAAIRLGNRYRIGSINQ